MGRPKSAGRRGGGRRRRIISLPIHSSLIPFILGADTAKWVMFLLAVAAFPPACFSAFIAANSFKTTLPKSIRSSRWASARR